MYRLKGKPKTASKLELNITFLPEGWKNGLQFALPKKVICFKLLPSLSHINNSISVGFTSPSERSFLYSSTSSFDLGLEALKINLLPSGEKNAPPS